jgi:hypothetical protein
MLEHKYLFRKFSVDEHAVRSVVIPRTDNNIYIIN